MHYFSLWSNIISMRIGRKGAISKQNANFSQCGLYRLILGGEETQEVFLVSCVKMPVVVAIT